MDNVRVIEVKRSIFESNDQDADKLRGELRQSKTFLLNLMSSPGSGKTTTLKRTIETLKDKYRIGVMEADIDSDVDAKAIAELGVKSIQLHTGGMCHLDADMTRQGIKELDVSDVDFAILENVGNLVCPAEFDTGSTKNAILINKMDVAPYFDFDLEKCKEYILMRNPKAKIIPICAKTGEGIEAWAAWLSEQIDEAIK